MEIALNNSKVQNTTVNLKWVALIVTNIVKYKRISKPPVDLSFTQHFFS